MFSHGRICKDKRQRCAAVHCCQQGGFHIGLLKPAGLGGPYTYLGWVWIGKKSQDVFGSEGLIRDPGTWKGNDILVVTGVLGGGDISTSRSLFDLGVQKKWPQIWWLDNFLANMIADMSCILCKLGLTIHHFCKDFKTNLQKNNNKLTSYTWVGPPKLPPKSPKSVASVWFGCWLVGNHRVG